MKVKQIKGVLKYLSEYKKTIIFKSIFLLLIISIGVILFIVSKKTEWFGTYALQIADVINIIYLMVPVITLLLTFSYTVSNNIRNTYGLYTYKRVGELKIIFWDNFKILVDSVLFLSVTFMTLICKNEALLFAYLIYSVLTFIKLCVYLILSDKDILSTYLDQIKDELMEKFSKVSLKKFNKSIYHLYVKCIDSGRTDDLDEINNSIYEVFCDISKKYSDEVNKESEEYEQVIKLYEILFEFSLKIAQSDLDFGNRNNIRVCCKFMDKVYKSDKITVFEEMMKNSLSYYIRERDLENRFPDSTFMLKFFGLVTTNIIDDENSIDFWQKAAIDRLTELLDVLTDDNSNRNIFVMLLLVEILTNKHSIARKDKLYATKLYDYFFSCSEERNFKVSFYNNFYVHCIRLLDEIKEDSPKLLIEELINAFKKNLIKPAKYSIESHQYRLLMCDKINEYFPNEFNKEDVQKLITEILTESVHIISDEEVNFLYIDYLFNLFVDNYLDDIFHQTIRRILRHLSMNNIILAQFVFNKYVKIFIEKIDNDEIFETFKDNIEEFLMRIIGLEDNGLFYNCFVSFTIMYDKYLEGHDILNHSYLEILRMYYNLASKSIDITNNRYYSIILDSISEVSDLKSKIIDSRFVDEVFAIMHSLAKLSLEKYYVDAIKTSSNLIAWYIKNHYLEKNKKIFLNKIEVIIEMFKLSLKIKRDDLIVPVFIGTAFIMLGSLLYSGKADLSIRELVLKIDSIDEDKDRLEEILSISASLRIDYIKDNKKSEFNNENFKKFIHDYKIYSKKK